MRASGAPLWNGADARTVTMVCSSLLMTHGTMPVASWLIPPVPLRPLPARLTRPDMLVRVRHSAMGLWRTVLAKLSCQTILYPLQCVRMRTILGHD